MFPSINRLLGTNKMPASQPVAVNVAKDSLQPTVPISANVEIPLQSTLPAQENLIPSRPAAPGSSKRPQSRGRTLKQTPRNCLCNKPFEEGGFKSAHELECTEANGVCYTGLDPETYNSKDFVALIIKDKLNSNGEIVIPVANMWESTINEIVRQLDFYGLGLSVDIPIVILEFTSDTPALIISKDTFYESFYTESTIKECPVGLKHIILIMERIQLPGPNFNVIDLANRLVNANVFSGDFKAGNAGTVGDHSVLIDWDPKFQFDIDPNMPEAERRNLVCYMVLTFLMELIDYMASKSNNIYAPTDNTELTDKLTTKLTDSNALFSNTRKKLKEYYPSIFTKDVSGREAILKVIESARKVFDEKPIDMFLNLINYDPVHNIQLLLYETDDPSRSLFVDTERQQYYNKNKPDPTLSGNRRYKSYETYIGTYFVTYIPFDINCLINMTFEINEYSIENQINTKYKSYLFRSNLLRKKGGGSRKRPKTNRRRSHKKKKNTRKMFR